MSGIFWYIMLPEVNSVIKCFAKNLIGGTKFLLNSSLKII